MYIWASQGKGSNVNGFQWFLIYLTCTFFIMWQLLYFSLTNARQRTNMLKYNMTWNHTVYPWGPATQKRPWLVQPSSWYYHRCDRIIFCCCLLFFLVQCLTWVYAAHHIKKNILIELYLKSSQVCLCVKVFYPCPERSTLIKHHRYIDVYYINSSWHNPHTC